MTIALSKWARVRGSVTIASSHLAFRFRSGKRVAFLRSVAFFGVAYLADFYLALSVGLFFGWIYQGLSSRRGVVQ